LAEDKLVRHSRVGLIPQIGKGSVGHVCAALARSTNDKLRILRAVGQVLLDATIDDAAVRAVSFARVPEAV